MMKISSFERETLVALRDETWRGSQATFCTNFDLLVQWFRVYQKKDVTRAEVRRSCRSLARKELAEYHRGLWTEDGEPAGAGYCITRTGHDFLQENENTKEK